MCFDKNNQGYGQPHVRTQDSFWQITVEEAELPQVQVQLYKKLSNLSEGIINQA